MPRKDAGGGPISAQAQQDLVSEGIENFELPKSIVTKIAKSAIPENAKLQKETVLSLVKGSTVFINYLGNCDVRSAASSRYIPLTVVRLSAHDVALSKQHKSISASDVLKALEMIEFGDLVDPLQNELQIYRDNTKGDKNRKSSVVNTSVSVNPSKGKAKEGENMSSASRSKGKAKATLPPLFTTEPHPASSISYSAEDVDMNVPAGENEDVGEEGGGRDYDSEMADEADDAVESYGSEEEEEMDLVPNEAEKPRSDAAGLDDVDPVEDES